MQLDEKDNANSIYRSNEPYRKADINPSCRRGPMHIPFLPSRQDIYVGIAALFRQELATQATDLLNDPKTARRLYAALKIIKAMRELRV